MAYTTNEHGLIVSPGKFEGEPNYVPHLWEVVLDGQSETVDADDMNGQMEAVKLTDEDKERYPALAGFYQALLWEDSAGFVYCDLMRPADWRA